MRLIKLDVYRNMKMRVADTYEKDTTERFRRKNNEEKKASGINPEYSELDNLLQDAYDLERDSTDILQEEQQKRKQDTERAENIRKR